MHLSKRGCPTWLLLIFFVVGAVFSTIAFATNLPATKGIESLTAATTLINMVDSLLFKFGARILAGMSILAAGWNLKEQRFAMAIICIFAAIILGTVPMWVKNILAMEGAGGGSVLLGL